MGWRYEFDFEEEDRIKNRDRLEQLEKILYFIKEEINGWDTETPETWANILSEIQRFIEELEKI